MKNNKGFTLVELIVVIAILGILAGVASYSINSVSTTRAKGFATKLSALISQCRVDTLSGSPSKTYLEITLEDDGYYATLYEGKDNEGNDKIKTRENLGAANVACAHDGTDFSAGDKISVSFDRTTGAVAADCSVQTITVAKGNGGYVITLVRSTGYHTLEKQGGS